MSSDWTQWPKIEDVLQSYGFDDIPSRSGWAPIRCQFHMDTVKSASVNTSANAFHCHSCDLGGVAIHIIMKRENLGYIEARDWAEGLFGVDDAPLPSNEGSPIPGMPGTQRGGRRTTKAGTRTMTVLGRK